MSMKLRNFIAQRELFYSLKGESHRRLLVVRVSAPYLIDRDTAGFSADAGSAACTVEFDGIEIGTIEYLVDQRPFAATRTTRHRRK